jgi:hypothetical protein
MNRPPLVDRGGDEAGVALVVAVMALSLMLALGLALTLTTMTEARIVANYQRGVEARYAVEAVMQRVLAELQAAPDWSPFLAGTSRASLVEALPPDVDVVATPAAHRQGAGNDPVWQLFASGSLASMLPMATVVSPIHVVVWVGDDATENDGDVRRDGGPPAGCDVAAEPSCADANPGRGVIEVLAQATGPDGTRRTLGVTVSRRGETADLRIVSWRQDD